MNNLPFQFWVNVVFAMTNFAILAFLPFTLISVFNLAAGILCGWAAFLQYKMRA